MVVEEKKEIKDFPPFKPAAYFGGNLLLGGLSYLLLRQYLRFFIYFALIIISSVTSVLDNLLFFIALASAIDAAIIAKRMKEKKIAIPEKNKVLHAIIITIWIICLVFILYSIYSAIASPINRQFFFGFG